MSRRQFLGGAAGLAAEAALPRPWPPARVRPARVRPAVNTHLVGATVDLGSYGVTDYIEAASIFDGYVCPSGRQTTLQMATTMQKIYMYTGSFEPGPPVKMAQLATAGCQFLVSVEPARGMHPVERTWLANWLAMLNSAGLNYRVVLYSEANNQAFRDQQTWQTYWSFYAPVIKDAGVPCGYDPGCSHTAMSRAEAYFPANPSPDELWMDYYGTAFRAGSRLDTLIGVATARGIPAGLAEWGWSSGNVVFNPMSMPWWSEYCSYLIHLAHQGSLPLGAIYFDGLSIGNASYPRVDVIASSSDPRIRGIRSVAKAIQAAP